MSSSTRKEMPATESLQGLRDAAKQTFALRFEADRAISHMNSGQIDGNVIRAPSLISFR